MHCEIEENGSWKLLHAPFSSHNQEVQWRLSMEEVTHLVSADCPEGLLFVDPHPALSSCEPDCWSEAFRAILILTEKIACTTKAWKCMHACMPNASMSKSHRKRSYTSEDYPCAIKTMNWHLDSFVLYSEACLYRSNACAGEDNSWETHHWYGL